MQWIAGNIGSIVCGLIVLAIAAAAFRSWLRARKNGCGGCGSCGSCGGCSACRSRSAVKENTDTEKKDNRKMRREVSDETHGDEG